MSKKLGISVYLFFLMVCLVITGGRIASSDGLTMFYVTQSLVENGDIAVPDGNTVVGTDGRRYSRYGVGMSIAAIPFYLAGKLAAAVAPEKVESLVQRGAVSVTNAFVVAGVCLLFFAFCLRLRFPRRFSFLLTVGLGVGSVLLPYSKSFLSEPMQALCLLGAAYGLFVFRSSGSYRWLTAAGVFAGFGLLVKVTFALNIVFLGLYLLDAFSFRLNRHAWRASACFVIPIVVFGLFVLAYNAARFGNPLLSGYGDEVTFSTPLLVGLFGLLLSSGKGFFWFTPLAIMGVFAFREFFRRNRKEALLIAALFVANLILYAKFVSWAGEGSWGPRYLVPLTPFVLLPIGALVREHRKSVMRWFAVLLTLGVLVQLPGISIYYGTYHRELGEFPYQRSFSDPLFLHKSRFVPNYSQIVGQWRMLVRNTKLLVTGDGGDIQVVEGDERIPLGQDQLGQLRYTLDYWFTYAHYIGLNVYPFIALIALMLATTVLLFRIIWRQTAF